jgi:hypothetical protein
MGFQTSNSFDGRIQITCRLRRGEAIANAFRLIGLLAVAAMPIDCD